MFKTAWQVIMSKKHPMYPVVMGLLYGATLFGSLMFVGFVLLMIGEATK